MSPTALKCLLEGGNSKRLLELNDPEDQAERFRKQVEEKEAGDDEAMFFDDDYIAALEHGLPLLPVKGWVLIGWSCC